MSEQKHKSPKAPAPAGNSFADVEKKAAAQNPGLPKPARAQQADVSGKNTPPSSEKTAGQKRAAAHEAFSSAEHPVPPGQRFPLPQPHQKSSRNTASRSTSASKRGNHTQNRSAARPNHSSPSRKNPLAKPGVLDGVKGKAAEIISRIPMKRIAIIGGSAVCALLIAYVGIAMAYSGQFLPNTYINEIPVGGMTKAEASEALLSSVETDALVLIKPDGSTARFDTAGYDAHYSVSDAALDEAFSENRFLWFGKLFRKSSYTIKYDYHYSVDDLREIITSYNWGSEAAQNAYIDPGSDGQLKVVPATQGDLFDRETLLTYICEQLAVGNYMVSMANSGCYDEFAAEIQAEDLTEELELCRQFTDCSITFDFGDRQEVLDGSTIAKWVQQIEGSTITFNRSKIEAYVADLADKYDTFGNALKFVSTLDGPITVPWTETSIYGWLIDRKSTVDHIIRLLQNVETITTKPIYVEWGIGYCRDAESGDIGNTYVEIDISAQHIWYYENGEILMESDCVTGTETNPDRRTPRGIFYIWNHEKDRDLVGEDYRQFVNFWMPINHNDVGLHDLARVEYGGSIYMYNGSHGCINLPFDFVRELFYATEDGIPVIVHD